MTKRECDRIIKRAFRDAIRYAKKNGIDEAIPEYLAAIRKMERRKSRKPPKVGVEREA